ncbi:helix-turn-helix transcriptional regulator [Mucilaginibacter sp. Bleaf8]|uniref:helix-turn-helix domain-containing protein n=1 Tax=Mucilaginibacter sp. Bleaf8 TaxID=2834430 RepID=UPI001BCA7A9F|nr:helix-turn-helix transcriptional regulator [Mucilaginibacter sp. Bleaf8]MBS7564777.1 helix-turn-helix transcriptional regulator [Mucilaginibacter sp. Bleaf8]
MDKTVSLEAFYREKIGILPSEIFRKTGHFNVFKMEDYLGPKSAYPMPYSRKDYYKIALIQGAHLVEYADHTYEVKHNMLMFANPLIPYKWTPENLQPTGAFCVFTEDYMKGFGHIKDYPLYQPGGTPILDITDEEANGVMGLFNRMFREIASEYTYKYDLLRSQVFELIHTGLKLRPAHTKIDVPGFSAGQRIASLFNELLDRQFPIESTVQKIQLKTPAEFADQLNVHINHLNRVLKETTGKTTTQLIAGRVASEARALLKHTDWNISEIAWCLGFEDTSNFVKFFKKQSETTPHRFRS